MFEILINDYTIYPVNNIHKLLNDLGRNQYFLLRINKTINYVYCLLHTHPEKSQVTTNRPIYIFK